MPAAKWRPVWPSTTTTPPVMYSPPWSPTPSTTAVAPEWRTANPLPGHAPEVAFAPDGAVEHGVTDEDVVVGIEAALGRRGDDQPPPGQALAHVVVGLPGQDQGDAVGQERPKALPPRAVGLDDNGVVRQPGVAVAPGHLARQHGPDGAVRVADGGFNPHRLAPVQGGLGLLDEPVIQRPGQAVVNDTRTED